MKSYKWITKSGVADSNNLIDLIKSELSDEQYKYVAFFSDKLESGYYTGAFAPIIQDTDHLLELRVFNDAEEFKAIRSQICDNFKWRIASEENIDGNDIYTELQYLDIDSAKEFRRLDSGTISVASTGGGRYNLPIDARSKEELLKQKIKIINYLNYDEKYGNLTISDFRIVTIGNVNQEVQHG